MKKRLLFILCLCTACALQAQHRTRNVVIVTLDGMRWQEVFKGADTVLINSPDYTSDMAGYRQKFWANTEDERR